jgi:hypothetical protein
VGKVSKGSQCTIKKIRKESKAYLNEVLSIPGKKKRKRPENCIDVADDFDWQVIQKVTQSFYENLKTVQLVTRYYPS